MSGGYSCKCDERTKAPQYRDWTVTQFRCNHSAFNGNHYTASEYSAVRCNVCRNHWRTKADYVNQIKDRKV